MKTYTFYMKYINKVFNIIKVQISFFLCNISDVK